MKTILRFCCGLGVCLGLAALAQEAAPTATPQSSAASAKAGDSTPAPLPTPAADLIPNPANAPSADQAAPPNLPDISALNQVFENTSLGKEADQYKAHLEWRQLQNRVQNDPDIVAAHEHAEAAKTDLEKRNRLRAYYQLLFARMRALAPSPATADYLADQRDRHLALMDQPRVRPTPFVSPTPAPSASPTPESSATPFAPLPVPEATLAPLVLPDASASTPNETPAPTPNP